MKYKYNVVIYKPRDYDDFQDIKTYLINKGYRFTSNYESNNDYLVIFLQIKIVKKISIQYPIYGYFLRNNKISTFNDEHGNIIYYNIDPTVYKKINKKNNLSILKNIINLGIKIATPDYRPRSKRK